MIESIEIKNFGPLADFSWSGLGSVNLVIGRHGTGKTFLLKALYCAIRPLEERRGDEPRTHAEILSDKLYWTFQPDRIGDLVRHGSNAALSVSLMLRDEILVKTPPSPVRFAFDRAAERSAIQFDGGACVRDARSIFIPAKEILSLQSVILRSRESDRMFGFDDT